MYRTTPAGGRLEFVTATSESQQWRSTYSLAESVTSAHALQNGCLLLGSSEFPWCDLIRFFPNLLSGTLLSQSLLDSASLARLQIEGVAFYVLDNVFRHDLTFETSKRVLQRLAFLQSNFCHSLHPKPAKRACFELTLFCAMLNQTWCPMTPCQKNKSTFIRNSHHRSRPPRRPHRHLLRPLPRQALAEGGDAKATDQKRMRQGILDVLWSSTNGTTQHDWERGFSVVRVDIATSP
jgi:hypothetical protein